MVDDTSAEDGLADPSARTRDEASGRLHPSPSDRVFLFRTLSALSKADVGFRDCLERIKVGMSGALEGDGPTRRRVSIATALAESSTVDDDPFLFQVFERNGFLLSAMERCALSIRMSEATPVAVAAVADAAAGFASEIRAK